MSGWAAATERTVSTNRPSENFMMLALCPAVTFRRPSARARSNANRAIRSEAPTEIVLTDRPESSRIHCPVRSATNAISSFVSGSPCSSSIPVYKSSVFSRITRRSIPSYGERTPGYERTGRTPANRSSSTRSETLAFGADRSTGVEMGPLSTTRVARIESRTRFGIGAPSRSATSEPAGWTSQSNATPVASSDRRAASTTSGPTPSPGISVAACVVTPVLHPIRAASVHRGTLECTEHHGGGARGRQRTPRGRRRPDEDLRRRRGERPPVVRRVSDRGPGRARLVRGGRPPPARAPSPHPGGARRPRRNPHRTARALAVPPGADAHARAADLADVDAPHDGLGGLGVRPGRVGQLPRGQPAQGAPADRPDPGPPRDVPPPPDRPGDRAAESQAGARGELPAHAPGRRALDRGRRGPRHHADPVRRPHDERLDVHRADHRLDARRHVLGDHRRDRRAEGTAPRRRERGGHEDARGGGGPGQGRCLRPRPARAAREGHGVRPRRVHDDRSASLDLEAPVARDLRAARRGALVPDLGGDRGGRRRAEGAPRERRLLRGERLPRARYPDRPDDPGLRVGPDGRMDGARARAVRRQQGDPALLRVRRTPRPALGADRGSLTQEAGRGRRSASSITARTLSARPRPITCTPEIP